MKTEFTRTQTDSGRWLVVFPLLLACLAGRSQTLVSGNISGTWAPAGNPYVAVDNCSVPVGQTLTIQPGVVVWIGSNVTITANGLIQAVGTPSQRIKFQAPVGSQYWNSISLVYGGGINRFTYCDFRNANTALSMSEVENYNPMVTEILNCTFSNCVSQAIFVSSAGAMQNPVIKNCIFDNTGNGCLVGTGWYYVWEPGYANPVVKGNTFQNLNGTAFLMVASDGAGSSSATFVNNTVVNCRVGVSATDPWDAKIQSCIFVGCSNAVMRSGSLSGIVGYNDFYLNATNFTGYPGTYGAPIIVNRNGTSSDLVFNVFQNPLFVGASDFHLTASSTCIDAGVGDPANFDSCFPPSLGSVTNDIGAYGGPTGCEWIAPPSTNIFTVALAQYYGVTINPPSNGHYRLEYASALGNTNNWMQLTNLTLTNPFTYFDPAAFGPRFYRAVLLP